MLQAFPGKKSEKKNAWLERGSCYYAPLFLRQKKKKRTIESSQGLTQHTNIQT